MAAAVHRSTPHPRGRAVRAPRPPSAAGRTSVRSEGRLGRTMAMLTAMGATYGLLVAAVPTPSRHVLILAGATALPCYLVALRLLAVASRASRLHVIALSVPASALAVAAATIATMLQPPGAQVGVLDHRGWAIGIGVTLFTIVVVHRLLTELRARVELLDSLARIDPLTEIANRRAWDEELTREMARAHREGSSMCLAIIDLDHFKAYNDLRGHQEGDRLLREVALVWRQTVRQTDFIARIGGEEFALMLRNCRIEDALPIVECLRVATGQEQTCSVGLTSLLPGDTRDDLTCRADAALYEAKAAGRNRVKVWCDDDAAPTAQQPRWPAVVTRLLETRSVVAAYQCVVRLEDSAIVAYEGLARPNRALVNISVEEMFSTAQRMGLGRDLDWLCRRAALVGAITMPAGMPLFINVGLSGLIDPVHRVDQMLLLCEAVGRRPQDLVLEITERELFGDLRRLREVVNTYRREGFRFAVDDVGEGHSTLEVLSVTEPEFLKLARSLVVGAVNRGPRAAIRAVVSFAGEVGADVIAEGIEQAPTARHMRELGVGFAQGYLFGRPEIPVAAAQGGEHFLLRSA